jgi:hypothetical protein
MIDEKTRHQHWLWDGRLGKTWGGKEEEEDIY